MNSLVPILKVRVLDAVQVRLEVDLQPVRVRAGFRDFLLRVGPQQLLLFDLVEHSRQGAPAPALFVSQLCLGKVDLGRQVGHLLQKLLPAPALSEVVRKNLEINAILKFVLATQQKDLKISASARI